MKCRVVMIIGMHRSGTSLLAQAVERLGVIFGDNLIPANSWNENGYYEYKPAVKASLEILRKLDRRPFSPLGLSPLPDGWAQLAWVKEIEDRLVEHLLADFQQLSISDSQPFGFKDPHATLLLPFWLRVFNRMNAQVDCVLTLRHPAAVVSSVWKRDRQEAIDTERMWLLYNLGGLYSGGDQIRLVVDYEKWHQDPDTVMESLVNFLHIESPELRPRPPFVKSLDHGSETRSIVLKPVELFYQRFKQMQPGTTEWKSFCREVALLYDSLSVFSMLPDARKGLPPLADDGQPVTDREKLNRRRQQILYPETAVELPRFLPFPETPCFESNKSKDIKVGIVAFYRPDPDSYALITRHTTELVNSLVQQGVVPTLLGLVSEPMSRDLSASVQDLWPDGTVVYQHVTLPGVPAVRGPLGIAANKAYILYEWLKKRDFDVIHAPDFHGALYFCLRAKQQGIAFAGTRFVIHPVWNLLAINSGQYQSPGNIHLLPRVYLESSCLELADKVPVPGRSTLETLLNAGMSLVPGNVEHWPLPYDPVPATADLLFKRNSIGDSVNRIICFPGASRRGVALFCKALQRGFYNESFPVNVEFAVPKKFLDDLESYIESLTADWNEAPLVTSVSGRKALLELLTRDPGTLWVIPVMDGWNMYPLLDLVALGQAVLVADRGAAAQIMDQKSVECCSCRPLPDSISQWIHDCLKGDIPVPGFELGKIKKTIPASWATPAELVAPITRPVENPLVSVCLMHFERPELVEQALASVEKQSYTAFEVVMVDDGSLKNKTRQKLDELQKRFKEKGWQVIRQNNRYLGAARNTAAMAARGQYLYFLDDDNVLKPHALETLVGVAEHLNADVVAALSDVFEGNESPESEAFASRRIIQVGDDLSYGFFRNAFGDSNALIRRSAFLSLGGNTEDYAVGMDDQEFFARALLNGFRLTVIPEALYWARQMPTRLRNLHFNPQAGNYRVCRAYLPHVPPKMRPLLLLTSGMLETVFEGRRVMTLREYGMHKIRKMAHSPMGTKLRFGMIGPLFRRLRERLGLKLYP